MPTAPYAVVLNGTSSAGKTSIARAMQRLSTTPILHASLDTFTDMFDWPSVKPADRPECHRTGVKHFNAALEIFSSCGFPLVVDHVFELPEWHQSCIAALGSRPTYFVGVRCPLAVVEEREKKRSDRRPGLARSQFERVHRVTAYAMEVDTSALSAEECARAILDFVRETEG